MKPKLIDDVIITTEFFCKEYNEEQDCYVFIYQITIENQSVRTIQLLERYWEIGNGLNWEKEVQGEGVIGEQPILYQAGTYSYSSWCPTPTEVSFMRGYYIFMDIKTNELIRVNVPQMNFTAPHLLN